MKQDGLIIFNRQLLNSALACYVLKCSGCWLVRSLSVLSKKLKGNRKNWYITKFWRHPNELLILTYRLYWFLNVPLLTLRGGEQAQLPATRMIRSVTALVVQYVLQWNSIRLAQELRMHFLPRTSQIHRAVCQATPLTMIQSTGLWLSLFIAQHGFQVLN